MLWLADLEVENVRRFAGRWRLAGLGPGLNVLVAPNEAGKSTLLAAIQAAIFRTVTFDRQTAKAALFEELAHRGSDQVAITLAIETGAGRFRLRRSFRRKGGAGDAVELLRPDGDRLRSDDAEAAIRRLFGVEPNRRGVWGALWVEQTRSLLPPALDEQGQTTLREAMADQAAIVTGERGAAAVVADLERVLEPLVTAARSEPRAGGAWKRAIDGAREAEETFRAIEAKLRQTEAWAAELATLHERARRRAEAQAEEALKRRLGALRDQREGLRIAAERRQRANRQAESTARLAAEAARKLQDRHRRAEALERQREAIATLEHETAAATARADAARRQRDLAAAACEQAEAAVEEARARRDRLERLLEAARLAAGLEGMRAALETARRLDAEAAAAEAERDALAIDAAAVRRLRDLADAAERARAALAEVAPEVSIAVARDGTVQAGEEMLPAGVTRRRLETPLTVVVPGIARITIAPAAVRLARAEDAERALAEALAALGVASLQEAEARLERWHGAAGRAIGRRNDLARVVAQQGATGLADLADRLGEAERRLAADLATLGVAPLPGTDELAAAMTDATARLSAAEAARDQARAALEDARRAAEAAERAAAEAAARLAAGTEALQGAAAALAADRASEPDEALAAAARDLAAKAEHDRAEAAALPEPDEAAIADLEAAIAELERQIEAAAAEREHDLRRRGELEGRLAQLAADGLAEQRHAARLAHEAATRRLRQEEDRVHALLLLREVLKDEIAKARADYLPALERHAEHFVRRLFPGASLGMDLAALQPARLGRDDAAFDLGRLSVGTREQIAILVRLAFARLLRDRGLPVFLILDDALAYADGERLAAMVSLLAEEARDVQILVFSCREVFDGVAARRLSLVPAA